jgi:hypothetical protein
MAECDAVVAFQDAIELAGCRNQLVGAHTPTKKSKQPVVSHLNKSQPPAPGH